MTPIDSLVDSYLSAVARAAADLHPQHREDLLTDLREHITTARAEQNPETEAGVRSILDRLGDPASIAAEARRDQPPHALAVNAHAAPRQSRSWVRVAVMVVLGLALAVCIVGAFTFAARSPSGGEPIPVSPRITQPSHAGAAS